MAKWWAVVILVLAAVAAALYFWVYRPQQTAVQSVREQLAAADHEAALLRTRVADLEAIRDQLQRTSADLQQQVAEKEKELQALRSTQDELVEGLKQEIADRQVQVERIKDKLRVDMVDEILFDSGEATLKPAGIAVLNKVGAILKKATNRTVEVQGHTDDVPIRGALTKVFPTNWELSAARATNVARFLQDTAKLDPRQLSATAYSEYKPKAANATEEGRRQNRRIEILLGPLNAPEEAPAH
jgi:chemotaxis protein MotB